MTHNPPLVFPGQSIGLLGGSFDPPHPGHVHISRWALRTVGVDAIWWLVSPGNPLKARGPVEIERRMAACRAVADHPRIHVTDIERHLGSPFTAHTLMYLGERCPGVRFVWLMGADNLVSFHLWQGWRWIIETHPIAVFGRPGAQVRAGLSPAARRYANLRVAPAQAQRLGRGTGAGWSLLTGPLAPHSSSEIRARGEWP